MLRSCALRSARFALLLLPLVLAGCSNNSGGGGGTGSGGSAPASKLSAAELAGFEKTTAKGKWGGTIIDAVITDPKQFNIVVAKETSSTAILNFVFDSLISLNSETLKYDPALAESYTHSTDGKTWTFKLRPGLKWSDGQPLTADDVLFSLDVIYDKNVSTSARDLMMVDNKPWGYKKLDDRTVEIDLPAPFGPFLDTAQFPIIPKHKLEAAWKAGQFNSTWGINTPPSEIVGSGPWTIAKYSPGDKIVMQRNPYYWKLSADGKQLPFMDGEITEIVPDVNTAILKFKSNETDLTGLRAQDWNDMKKDESSGNYKATDYGPTWGNIYMSFNQNPRTDKVPAYKREWFTKKEFRQAVSYALDRDAIVATVYRKLGRPLWSPVSEANKVYYDPNVKKYPHDPAQAQALLAKIGLANKNADGYLQDAAGHVVEFNLMTNTGVNTAIQVCTIIQDNLKQIGIKVNVVPVEFNSLVTRLNSTFDWEAVYLAFTGGVEPYGGANIWRTTGHLHVWNQGEPTPATPWEAEVDQIFNEVSKTVDVEKRKQLYNRWQEIVTDELPLIYLVTPDYLLAARNKFSNLRPNALGLARWNIWEISTL